jgi:hypothetical protein
MTGKDHLHTWDEMKSMGHDTMAHHLHDVHEDGDWRQFDRLPEEVLRERHLDLHGYPHKEIENTLDAWAQHMRVEHLTEPVRAGLGLIKAQHARLHPQPGHTGGLDEPRFARQVTLMLDEVAELAAKSREPGRPEITRQYPTWEALEEAAVQRSGKEQGLLQAKVNEKYDYAQSCAATAKNGQGFWLNAINAYQELLELIAQGYPLPEKLRRG